MRNALSLIAHYFSYAQSTSLSINTLIFCLFQQSVDFSLFCSVAPQED
jgi:hypothetical protein